LGVTDRLGCSARDWSRAAGCENQCGKWDYDISHESPWAPNGLELTGDGGTADGVRCSDVLGALTDMLDLLSSEAADSSPPQFQGPPRRFHGSRRTDGVADGEKTKAFVFPLAL
jgi:hypothetical protein